MATRNLPALAVSDVIPSDTFLTVSNFQWGDQAYGRIGVYRFSSKLSMQWIVLYRFVSFWLLTKCDGTWSIWPSGGRIGLCRFSCKEPFVSFCIDLIFFCQMHVTYIDQCADPSKVPRPLSSDSVSESSLNVSPESLINTASDAWSPGDVQADQRPGLESIHWIGNWDPKLQCGYVEKHGLETNAHISKIQNIYRNIHIYK